MESFNNWLCRAFVVAWIAAIGAGYLSRNAHYLTSNPGYALLALTVLLAMALFFLWVGRSISGIRGALSQGKSGIVKFHKLNGLKVYGLVLFVATVTFGFYGVMEGAFARGVLPALGHFVGFSLIMHAAVLFVILSAFGIGGFCLRLIRINLALPSQALLAVGVGFSLLTLVLFWLGAVGLLNRWTALVVLVVCISLYPKGVLAFFKQLTIQKWKPANIHVLAAAACGLLLIIIGLNLSSVMRPLPLGFDSIHLYLNTSNLVSDYHALTRGGQAFNWSLVSSLGFSLFGSTPIALTLMMLPGILATIALYRIARLFLDGSWALVASAVAYSIPIVIWQSTNDTKVDLAMVFISLCALLLILKTHRGSSSPAGNTWKSGMVIWGLAGWLMGFAFGIKYTAAFGILGMLCILAYRQLGRLAFLGVYFSAIAILMLQVDRFGLKFGAGPGLLVAEIGFGSAGILLLLYSALQNRARVKDAALKMLAFAGAAILAFSPWAVKHITENDRLSVDALLQGKTTSVIKKEIPSRPDGDASFLMTHPVSLLGVGYHLLALQQEVGSNEVSRHRKSGLHEELTRYAGYEEGLAQFMTLPYDVTLRANVEGTLSIDPSFIPLMLLPLLFLSGGRNWRRNAALMLVIAVVWIVSVAGLERSGVPSAFGFMGTSSVGNALYNILSGQPTWLALVIMSLLPPVVWMIVRPGMTGPNSDIKLLFAFVMVCITFWILFGAGVPWYGLTVLMLSPMVIIIMLNQPSLVISRDRFTKFVAASAVGAWLLLSAGLRITDFEPSDPNLRGPYHSSMLPYMAGSESARAALNRMDPAMVTAIAEINRDLETKVLRIGTHITYFIKENDRRVMMDNQLDFFERLWQRALGKTMTTRRLRHLGFRFIVVDLNTASIDKTPDRSLTMKYNHLVEYLTDNDELRLISTDRLVHRPGSKSYTLIQGQQVPVANGFTGQVIYPGRIAVFEIPR